MEDKIELIRCFDVDRFIDWHSKLYEEIPLDLLEAEKRANDEIYSEWELSKSNILNGTKKKPPKRKKQLTNEQTTILEEYRERQQWVGFLKKGGIEVIDSVDFNAMKMIVANHENEVNEIKKLTSNQFIRIDYTMSLKLDEYSNLVELDIIQLALQGQYIFKNQLLKAAQTFCNVKVCQWLIDELDKVAKIKEKKPFNAAQKVAILYAVGVVDYLDSFGASVPETEKALIISTLIESDQSNIRGYLSQVRSDGNKCPKSMENNKKDALAWIKENTPVLFKQRQGGQK